MEKEQIGFRFFRSGAVSKTNIRLDGRYAAFERAAFPEKGYVPIVAEQVELGHDGATLARGVRSGALEFGPVECPAFDWLLPWWNADSAGSGSLAFFLSVQGDPVGEERAGWSPWYPMGEWGAISKSFEARDEQAKVETDTLKLAHKARAWKLKVEFSAGEEGLGMARLSRCGVIVRDASVGRVPGTVPGSGCEVLPVVPARSQLVEDSSIRGRICSPTCVSMALEALGREYPTRFVASDCHDSGAGIYGNWPFNVASLWRLGARARLDYFTSMDEAAACLDRGYPFIASVRFGEGELSGSPVSKTSGHLILVRGLERDSSGRERVLVNDPASPDLAGVPRSYDLREFERAWKGVAYVIESRRM